MNGKVYRFYHAMNFIAVKPCCIDYIRCLNIASGGRHTESACLQRLYSRYFRRKQKLRTILSRIFSLCHYQSGGFHYRQHFRSRRTARPEAESSAHSK